MEKHIMHTQRTKQEKVFILSRLHFKRSTSARVLTAGHAMLRAMKEIYPLNPDPLGLRAFWNFRVKTDQRNGRQHAHINYLSPQLPRSCRSVGTPAQAFSWHPLMTRKRKQGKVTSTGKWEKHIRVQNVIRVCEIYELARVRNQP